MKAFLLLFLPLFLFASLQKVSVQLEWKHQFEFAGFYAAIEKGYYRDVGLEVALKEFQDGINISDDVINTKSTFGISSSSLILNKLKNKPVVLMASYFKQNALALVTSKDIKDAKDLKNKKIMAMPYEIQHTSLGVMLKENKITQDDFTLVPHQFTIDKFINGEVDAMSIFITSQPFELNQKNIPYNILNPSEYGIYSYDCELFTSEKFAKLHPKIVKNFIQATNKGWKYAFSHKDEIVDVIYNKYSKRKSKESLLYEANETERIFKTDIFKIGSVVNELIELNTIVYKKLGLVAPNLSLKNLLSEYVFNSHSNTNVLNLTKEEIDFLDTHKEIVLGTEKDWEPSVIVNDDGTLVGYDKELLDLINKLSGANFTLVAGKWQDMLTKVKTKEIDGLADSAVHKERASYVNYSNSYYFVQKFLITTKENPKNIKKIEDLNNKTIAIHKSNLEDKKLAHSIQNAKVLEFDSLREVLNAVITGEADAMFGNGSTLYLANKMGLLTYIKHSGTLKHKLHLVFALRKDWPEAITIINKALQFIGKEKLLEMKGKWFLNNTYAKNQSVQLQLTTEEKEYLQNKKKITVCIDKNWMPYQGYIDNKHTGLSSEYHDIFQKKMGLDLEIIDTKNWSQSLEYAQDRKCDILSMALKTPQREEYMNFSSPLININLVLATKIDKAFINDITMLKQEKIAIPKDYAYIEILRDEYPQLNIVEVETIKEGLEKVRDGEVYGFIGSLANIGYMFQKEFTGELKIAAKFDKRLPIYVAVRNDDSMLLNIFNKTIDTITQEEHKKIFNKWVAIKYEKGVDYTIVWKVLFVSFIILLAVLYWLRKLSMLNKELHIAKRKAENAAKTKANFLANVTHEIKTPMNAIVGMSYLIKETALNDTQYKYVEQIELSSKNLLHLIDEILDFSTLEVNLLQINKVDFSLLDLLNKIENMFMVQIYDKGLKLEVIYDKSEINYLHGDSMRISQVLINLLSNAIKFTQKGTIKLFVEKSHSNFRFTVSDTGIGIKKEALEHIFLSFTQVDGSSTRKYGGTGLGLTIAKELVELMGGELLVSSTEGEGSVFSFSIKLENSSKMLQQQKLKKVQANQIEETLPLLNSTKSKKMFENLKEAVEKRRPHLCEPILEEFSKYQLTKEDKRLFNDVKILIKKYKFNEARRLL